MSNYFRNQGEIFILADISTLWTSYNVNGYQLQIYLSDTSFSGYADRIPSFVEHDTRVSLDEHSCTN